MNRTFPSRTESHNTIQLLASVLERISKLEKDAKSVPVIRIPSILTSKTVINFFIGFVVIAMLFTFLVHRRGFKFSNHLNKAQNCLLIFCGALIPVGICILISACESQAYAMGLNFFTAKITLPLIAVSFCFIRTAISLLVE